MNSGDEYPKALHGKWLVKKSKGIFVLNRTLGFDNSVIPVIRVIVNQQSNYAS